MPMLVIYCKQSFETYCRILRTDDNNEDSAVSKILIKKE